MFINTLLAKNTGGNILRYLTSYNLSNIMYHIMAAAWVYSISAHKCNDSVVELHSRTFTPNISSLGKLYNEL